MIQTNPPNKIDKPIEKADKRKHVREYLVKAIECTSYQQSNQQIEFDGVMANISQTGICLLTTEALKNGQEIIIMNHVVTYPRTATIRWSRTCHGLYYRYGLEFT
jgi:hypothetical protein